jgi:hypothetical protein
MKNTVQSADFVLLNMMLIEKLKENLLWFTYQNREDVIIYI